MRPPRPVPSTSAKSSISSSASFNASGLIGRFVSIVTLASDAGAGGGAPPPVFAATLVFGALKLSMKASTSASLVSASANTASNTPTSCESFPAGTISFLTTASYSASTSLVILAVSIRHIVCPLVNASPSFTIHSATVPSVISMPHLGMVNARILAMPRPLLPGQRLADGGLDLVCAWQIVAL